MTPRGIRNNNPLNLVKSSNPWLGKIEPSTDRRFEQFTSMEYGLRAGILTIRSYITKHHLSTLGQIISRWAPPTENNTEAYINSVCQWTGLDRQSAINIYDRAMICKLVQAMCHVECGQHIALTKIRDAYSMALANS